jgi:amino acid transporter
MTSFMVAYVNWINSTYIILIIAIIGSTIGSFGLTTFFSAPYLIPSQIAKEQTDKNNKANQAMFFGVQGIVVAISNALNEPV